MRLTETLKQWLKEEEWTEEPEIDEEKQTSSTSFNFDLGDHTVNCWFEINEQQEVFKLYMYFLASKAPEDKLDEVQKFISAKSVDMLLGHLQLLRDERVIRYYNAIDVENASFEPAHITNMLNAGLTTMRNQLPNYITICFGSKTADEVLAEE